MKEALKARQANMDSVNVTHKAMGEESKQLRVAMPEYIQEKVNKLNSDWASIRYMAANLRPASDSSVEALIQRGRANYLCCSFTLLSVVNTICTVRWWKIQYKCSNK